MLPAFKHCTCCILYIVHFWLNQKLLLLMWQKSKRHKISICKCENVLPFDLEHIWTPSGNINLLVLTKGKGINIARGSSNGKKCSRSNGKKISQLQIHIFCLSFRISQQVKKNCMFLTPLKTCINDTKSLSITIE